MSAVREGRGGFDVDARLPEVLADLPDHSGTVVGLDDDLCWHDATLALQARSLWKLVESRTRARGAFRFLAVDEDLVGSALPPERRRESQALERSSSESRRLKLL